MDIFYYCTPLIINQPQFKICLWVFADSAEFRSISIINDVTAVAANPDGLLLFGENCTVFHVVQQFEVALLMLLFDVANRIK